MNKRKLIILQPTVGAYRVGFYRHLQSLSSNLLDITVLCSSTDTNNVKTVACLGDGIQFFNNIPCYSMLGNRAFWQPVLRWSWQLNKGDIFLINGNPRYLSNIVASLIAKVKGAKIVWWGHGWTAGGGHLNAKIRFWLMHFFDHVFLYTDEEVNRFRTSIGYNVSLSGLNNGIDVDEIRQNIGDFSPHSESYRIGFIGRLENKSHIEVLITALARLKSKPDFYDKIDVDVIGSGSCMYRYIELAKSLGVSDKFHWHGAIWDPSSSNSILTKCACFVYPGQVGLSVVHAFALGLPAIVHNSLDQQMPEINAVVDGTNGLFFNFNEADDLADKIYQLLSNRTLLNKMRAAAFDTVSKTFNARDMAERFFSSISKLT